LIKKERDDEICYAVCTCDREKESSGGTEFDAPEEVVCPTLICAAFHSLTIERHQEKWQMKSGRVQVLIVMIAVVIRRVGK
jgi:hypothetical protein